MRCSYFRFRIFLIALTLGLAFVWFINGLEIAWNESRIDSPKAESDSILFVDPIQNRQMSELDASGPFSEKYISLERESNKTQSEFYFRVTNKSNRSIFLPFSLNRRNTRNGFYPYWLECRTQKNTRYRPVGPEFHNGYAQERLDPGEYFVFSVTKPAQKGGCVVSGWYYANEHAAWLVNNKLMDLSEAEQKFLDREHRQLKLIFRNE